MPAFSIHEIGPKPKIISLDFERLLYSGKIEGEREEMEEKTVLYLEIFKLLNT